MPGVTEIQKERIKTEKINFASDQLIRWCPGCGDYAILAAMLKALPQLDTPKENFVFISGIGCAARFPYYIDTYGFHTIHGRGPAIATGIKLANPRLSVWEIQGDGDALAIGGNHFIHAVRRNIDFNILLFNNEIYGLTKGQSSPTSSKGLVTKSTPYGVYERPFRAADLVLGAQGTYYARTIDTSPKQMTHIFINAAQHRGTSVVEILQNCIIFNDRTHAAVTAKDNREDFQLHLEHGKPMLFGKEKQKGIRLNGLSLEVVTLGTHGVLEKDILIHDAHTQDNVLHTLLARLAPPDFPIALGVIREVKTPTYIESKTVDRNVKVTPRTVNDLIRGGATWEVK